MIKPWQLLVWSVGCSIIHRMIFITLGRHWKIPSALLTLQELPSLRYSKELITVNIWLIKPTDQCWHGVWIVQLVSGSVHVQLTMCYCGLVYLCFNEWWWCLLLCVVIATGRYDAGIWYTQLLLLLQVIIIVCSFVHVCHII